MKKIYKFRVILSVKSYNEGELYEREIKKILKDYGEEAQFGKMEYINECLCSLDEGENRADCKAILQEMVKVLKIRY